MLNHTDIQGRFVANPELRDTNSGVKVVNFRIAWSEKVKDRETKLFIECKAFSALAEHICKYFIKGQEVIVEGKLNTEEWKAQDGQNRSKIVLIVNGVHFCGSRKEGGSAQAEAPAQNGGFAAVETDEMPF